MTRYIEPKLSDFQRGFQAGAASLDAEVAKWNTAYTGAAEAALRLSLERDQLRAHVNRLREEINDYAYDECGFCIDPDAAEVRDATPEQSLAKYRNNVIEAFVNEFSRHVGGDGEFWLHELQDFAMKEKP